MNQIIMAYQGEMALKGLNRRTFERALIKMLHSRLNPIGGWQIHTAQSTIYIQPSNDAALANMDKAFVLCEKTFGIASLSRAYVCEKNIDAIKRTATQELHAEIMSASTFKVFGKRSDKTFPMNSMELARELGAYILSEFEHIKVDIKHPELPLTVEIREAGAYVHAGKQKGAGGLPIPTSGRAMLLLSGGLDSPVAAYLMAKRGLGLVAIHFESPPYTSPRATAKVQKLADLLVPYAGRIPLYVVPYTKTQEYLRDNLAKQEYFTVIMRRSMMRIAGVISEKEQCKGLITGESLAQVASQTLEAIACTDAAQELPVLRPCIGMDKNEIIDIARNIGTYETSIQPYEDCCTLFTPAHPKTKPKMVDILRLEAELPQLAKLEEEAAEQVAFTLR